MKTLQPRVSPFFTLVVLAPLALGAQSVRAAGPEAASHLARHWDFTEVAPPSEPATGPVAGQATTEPHHYFTVGTGLNYLDETGNWQESQDLIELLPDGSAGSVRAPNKIYFNPNLNAPTGAITIVTASNQVFKTSLLGLFWYDPASGETVRISPIRDCQAELLPPNQIIYRSALNCGDVRVTCTKAGMEVDVILTQRPRPPETYFRRLSGATCRLELWHEWFGTPQPQTWARVLHRETNATLRAALQSEPDLVDEKINLANLWFPGGRAFSTDSQPARSEGEPARIRIPHDEQAGGPRIGKRWQVIDHRNVLVESVRWVDIQPQLADLPEMASASPRAKPDDGLLAGGESTPREAQTRDTARHLQGERADLPSVGSPKEGLKASMAARHTSLPLNLAVGRVRPGEPRGKSGTLTTKNGGLRTIRPTLSRFRGTAGELRVPRSKLLHFPINPKGWFGIITRSAAQETSPSPVEPPTS